MILSEISLKNFKNYREESISLGSQITLLYGDNGSGKSNLLEAIYFLQTLKPLRQAELIQWGSPNASLIANKLSKYRDIKYSIFLSDNERKLKIGEKSVQGVDEFLKGNVVVAFLPQHLWIIKGGPSVRRDYIDRSIFNYNFNYLYLFRKFKKVLLQRNAYLKLWTNSADKEVWDEQLINSSIPVIKERSEFIKKIAPIASEIYSFLSTTNEVLTLSYDMSKDGVVEGDDLAIQGRLRLGRLVREERAWQSSLWGPHRHDIKVLLNGNPLSIAGSQGEQRLGIIALKLAEIELLRQSKVYPLILLDDLASELDPKRRSLILTYLQRSPHQAILTACDPSQWEINSAKTVTTYRVTSGQIRAIS